MVAVSTVHSFRDHAETHAKIRSADRTSVSCQLRGDTSVEKPSVFLSRHRGGRLGKRRATRGLLCRVSAGSGLESPCSKSYQELPRWSLIALVYSELHQRGSVFIHENFCWSQSLYKAADLWPLSQILLLDIAFTLCSFGKCD